MLENFIANLRTTLTTLATIGYITVCAFIVGIEYKFYKDKLDDTRFNKIVFIFAEIITIFILLFMYFVVFQRFKNL